MLAARALSSLQQHYQRRKRRPVHPAAALDIYVCTGKVCKKQGSPGVLQFAQSLQLPDVTFTSCGCLSGCGNGPNLVIQQKGRQPEKISHVGTASHLLAVLRLRDVHLDPNLEKATALRVRGNEAAKVEDYATAITYYTQV